MKNTIQFGGYRIPLYSYDTVIVGSGASGFGAAERLHSFGHQNIAVITEHINAGTSRNTGSDKQTYYKLTLAGEEPDSVREMAATLMEDGCVDGDLALCEAALSSRCFLHLVELGVPFPCNRYGEYIGYKTDHDPRKRASSAGPYTSKMMTEALERTVIHKNIPIHDRMQAIRILTHSGQVLGILCLDLSCATANAGKTLDGSVFALFRCRNLVYATGGPAGIYKDSVYPQGHFGATGLALEAGAAGKNLTEWQYGLASLKPRWNVSGTYMQSLPRFISTLQNGSDEKEFLADFFSDKADMLLKVFLKGYQWPFDVRKIAGGSSIIDILVYLETKKGRRVFLDFRQNPGDGIDFPSLSPEVRDYLQNCNACFGTPIERLNRMNEPAVAFYRDHGINLEKEPLEIAMCAQHNNGGLSIDPWWQTNLRGLFCIGEAACSHGVYRPGGTALNAGQVGALRAAQYIAAQQNGGPAPCDDFSSLVHDQVMEMIILAERVLKGHGDNVVEKIHNAQGRMSSCGAAFRCLHDLESALEDTKLELASLDQSCHAKSTSHLTWLYRLRDLLICQQAYLTAMADYARTGGPSRGSALYADPHGIKPYSFLPDLFTYRLDTPEIDRRIQELWYTPDKITIRWRGPRPLPQTENFFENVWKTYRKHKNIL